MSAFRALSKHTRSLSRTIPARPAPARRVPLALQGARQLAAHEPPPRRARPCPPSTRSSRTARPTPRMSHAGTQTYVVSEPDPADTPYEVPSGAYPTSAPYHNFAQTGAPETAHGAQRSSTSASTAHPTLTRAVPQSDAGVMESAAVRHGEAPGQMRAGSEGGLGLMDASKTTGGEGSLAERNPAPDTPAVAERWSKMGNDNAWKDRK
ncbi:hypothetical protein EVJ58_g1440 [Rhodofomes roseus]|uniref:Uncharacterized protein n=1 Tax=Rhodofomes roseus TaxID=34475 RepID=A0A4Y9YZ87_9APHY|nr:hypothetical protein EVJ58_g1440 [Rhodofomes roseus]